MHHNDNKSADLFHIGAFLDGVGDVRQRTRGKDG